jgi:hypothetical protein
MAGPPLKYKKFEYDSEGLTVSGYERSSEDELENELAIAEAKAQGKVVFLSQRRRDWWEAQVRLYGLKCSKWTIDGMKSVLSDALDEGIEVSAEIKALEERLAKEYSTMDKGYKNTPISEVPDALKRTVDVLRWTSMPANATDEDRAKRVAEFQDHVRTTSEASRARQLVKMNREHARLVASADGAGNDIFGTWQFDCPEIPKLYGHDAIYKDGNIVWKIHPPLADDARLWCSFNQIIVEGVTRIEWKSSTERNNWRNRKNKFVFRGTGCGDGGLMCDDEWNKGWIKFTSEHECFGEFETQHSDNSWAFTGKKIGLKLAGKKPRSLMQDFNRLGREFEREMFL